MPTVRHDEIAARIGALGTSVEDRLTTDQQGWLAEFIKVGEYQLALEMVADWLSEERHAVTAAERAELRALAQAIDNNVERIMRPLESCPTSPSSQLPG